MKPLNKWLTVAAVGIIIFVLLMQIISVEDLQYIVKKVIEKGNRYRAIMIIGFYILCCILLMPVWFITTTAGFFYNPLVGTLLTTIGASIGSTVSFTISRILGRNFITNLLHAQSRLYYLDLALEKEGWKIVFLCRLSPIFPFAMLSYLFGLTKISLTHHALATAVGVLPANFVYVYVGHLTYLGITNMDAVTSYGFLYGGGLIISILISYVIIKIVKKALPPYLD